MEDYSQARLNMVESQIRPNDVTDHRLLAALLELPREEFVSSAQRPLAYADDNLQLKAAQGGAPARYLMEPMPLAKLLQLADIRSTDLVLEIGCATGYSAALLSRLADTVVTLESDEELAARANEVLPELQIGNVAVVTGPLEQGYASEGPYDVIVIGGLVPEVPEALFGQLKDGGRLVAVVGRPECSQAWLFTRDEGRTSGQAVFNAVAKPLPGFEKPRAFVF